MYKITSSDGTKIVYEKTGDGPPIIIVGGAFNDRNSGAGLAQALSPHFTVVTYDRRGRGASGDSGPYSVDREVEDLGAVIKKLGGSAGVFGSSSGGTLALETAAAGYSIPKLALFEPPYRFNKGPKLGPAVVPTLTELTRAGKRGETVEYFLSAVMRIPKQGIAHMRQMPMWPGLEAISHTLIYDTLVVGDRRWPADRMASIKEPTLVISSSASSPWIQHSAQRVAHHLAGGAHQSVNGAPHDASPEILAPVLTAFFRE